MAKSITPARSSGYNTKTRENVLNCAIELIKEYGYANVTINKICERACITKSTFYYHFSSKEALLEDFVIYVGHIAEKNMSSILAQDTFVKQIGEIFKLYCTNDIDVGHEIVKQIYISKLTANQEQDFPHSAYLFKTVTALVAKAQNSGEIANMADPERLTELLFHINRSLTVTWSVEKGEPDLIANAFEMINAALQPNEGFELV